MSAITEQVQTTAPASKALWAAIGVLGVAVVAMGATLVHVKTQPTDPGLHAVPAALSLQADEALVTANNKRVAAVTAAEPATAKSEVAAAPVIVPVSPVQKAIKQASLPPRVVPAPVKSVAVADAGGAPATQIYPTQVVQRVSEPVARPICATCGTVESVTPVERQAKPSGVGVVAGGVLGAVLGNQIGKGSGRAVATVAGAVGGGWAGNAIEKNMKKTTAYQVHVRMEDGSLKTVEQTTAAAIGARVTVSGGVIRPANDNSVATPEPMPEPAVRPTAVPIYTKG